MRLSAARRPDVAATGAAAAAPAAAKPVGAPAAASAAAQPSSPRDSGGASPRGGHQPTAFVRNIHRDTTDEELQEVFAECGAIKGMRHVRHPAGTSKVCAQQNEYHERFRLVGRPSVGRLFRLMSYASMEWLQGSRAAGQIARPAVAGL